MTNETLPVTEAVTPGVRLLREPVAYDWTPARKDDVILDSQFRLDEYIQGWDLDARRGILKLALDIDQIFKNGGEVKFGEHSYFFSKNTLPAHSEYHVAKVLTLALGMEEALSKEMEGKFNDEDRMALIFGVLIHDLGSLVYREEGSFVDRLKTQVNQYERHELASLNMVDAIMSEMKLSQNVDRERLKAKIKILIATTAVPLDMNWQNDNLNEIPILKELKSEIQDSENEPDLNKTPYIDLLKYQVRKARRVLKGHDTSINPELVKIMAAADHGSYLMEPCRTGEVIGLWQELNRYFYDWMEIKYRHRDLPKDTKSYYEYFISNFPAKQAALFGGMLRKLEANPFIQGYSVEDTLSAIEVFREKLSEKADNDPLVRFEGFFSPSQLEELMHSLNLETAFIQRFHERFSEKFSQKLHEPGQFDALATEVLQAIYREIGNRYGKYPAEHKKKIKEFFQKSLLILTQQESLELQENGRFNLHIAPFAYLDAFSVQEDNVDGFIDTLAGSIADPYYGRKIDAGKARIEKDDERKKRMSLLKTVTLTYRHPQDKDRFDEMLTSAVRANSEYGDKGLSFEISIAGNPVSDNELSAILQKAQEKGVKTTVHFGLEKSDGEFDKRMKVLLEHCKKGKMISVHVDNHFERFVRYYKENLKSDENNQAVLKELIKTINPLGYILTKGRLAFDTIKEFYRLFPNTVVASHNANMSGDMGLSLQKLFEIMNVDMKMKESQKALT